jgi:uncharacterized phage protein (TIGR01671 family)
MARKLKFRAWDNLGKQWLFPYPHGFAILGETTCFDMIMDQMCKSHKGATLSLVNHVEIVQHTGLNDKSGVEIYEGDIIDAFYSDDHPDPLLAGTYLWTGLVYYEQTLCTFHIRAKMKGIGFLASVSKTNCKDYVVKGNVHENPELLAKVA